jgi:hypothetical protein
VLLAFRAFNGPMVLASAMLVAAVQSRLDTSVHIPSLLGGRDTEIVPSWLGLLVVCSLLAFSLRFWRVATVSRAVRPVGIFPGIVVWGTVAASAGTYAGLGGPHVGAYVGALLFTIGLTVLVFVVASPVASAGVTSCVLLCSIEYATELPLASHLRVLDVGNPDRQLVLGGALLVVGTVAISLVHRSRVDTSNI